MKTILIVGPDLENSSILKLRLEVEGFSVETAAGIHEATVLLKREEPLLTIIDMINYDPEEIQETNQIIKLARRRKCKTMLLVPRRSENTSLVIISADIVISKPYDVTLLTKEAVGLINNPRKSSTSRRDSRQQSSDAQ